MNKAKLLVVLLSGAIVATATSGFIRAQDSPEQAWVTGGQRYKEVSGKGTVSGEAPAVYAGKTNQAGRMLAWASGTELLEERDEPPRPKSSEPKHFTGDKKVDRTWIESQRDDKMNEPPRPKSSEPKHFTDNEKFSLIVGSTAVGVGVGAGITSFLGNPGAGLIIGGLIGFGVGLVVAATRL